MDKTPAFGLAATDSSGIVSPFHFSRRANGDHDITLKILYCGICHGDVHFLRNELGHSTYPMVAGHEIVGEVIKVGHGVTKFKAGDIAGVGPICGSCRSCSNCNQGWESYCPKKIFTYNAYDHDGSLTQGGYSDKTVVDEHFAIKIPKGLPLDGAAPLLCAGITVYSPMKFHGLCQPGQHLGVVGLGGLGHVAVKFAKALKMKVTVISTSPGKKKEALESLGADAFLLSNDPQQLQAGKDTLDGIIDTVAGPHSLYPLVDLLKTGGKLITVGASITPPELPTMPLMMGRKMIAGSAAGGMGETQEMIDLAAKHNITADIEVIPMDYVNTALERVAKNDVKYRFVIDVANTLHKVSLLD
ncbi:probable mannitol dehydrogenase isoform X1 [Prosopis cineraria]|uniref:probable mannitol dehydrogenase isoform X1 n=1 Tax=Prosopis cineraria TaxID=364024 RepID=UPI00240FDACE|nr:probable mannitol dehydrogenase isoform X1 [Prosopis cineraria]